MATAPAGGAQGVEALSSRVLVRVSDCLSPTRTLLSVGISFAFSRVRKGARMMAHASLAASEPTKAKAAVDAVLLALASSRPAAVGPLAGGPVVVRVWPFCPARVLPRCLAVPNHRGCDLTIECNHSPYSSFRGVPRHEQIAQVPRSTTPILDDNEQRIFLSRILKSNTESGDQP